MKLLALCGFLFVCLLCLNIFAAEGTRVRRRCCSKASAVNKNPHKGIGFKVTPVETRRSCKPCSRRVPVVFSGPLPQLK
ncbi:unnamed protein product [Coccothraustes coccothraustes]